MQTDLTANLQPITRWQYDRMVDGLRPSRDSAGALTEPSELEGTMVEVPPALLDRVVEALAPEQVWLFGSRTRGEARADSDWDLLAVLPDAHWSRVSIRSACGGRLLQRNRSRWT